MAETVRTVNPYCRWFHWIGQSFVFCDQCSKPIWEHEGLPQWPMDPFDDTPSGGTPWTEEGRWYRIHQCWLQGWDIEAEGDVVHLREPKPEPEPPKKEIGDVTIAAMGQISLKELASSLVNTLGEDDLVKFFALLDEEAASWEVTKAVFDHFREEMERAAEES